MADPVRFNPGLFDDDYTPPSSLGSPVIFSPGLFDDDEEEEKGFLINTIAGAGERGAEIAANLTEFVGNVAQFGSNVYDFQDRLGEQGWGFRHDCC